MFTSGGQFAASARVTEGNRFKPYPFGKKNEPKKGCCDIIQAWNAWRTTAMGYDIYITPVHCALMGVQLSTDFMVQTCCGRYGFHHPCTKYYWDTPTFIQRREELQRVEGQQQPILPRLALETHPTNYGEILAKAEPLLPTAKAPPPSPMKSESESDNWGSW